MAQATAASIALLLVLLQDAAPWALPLLFVCLLAGRFPSRKALLEERWGFAGYAGHIVRIWAAFGTVWLLLAATPFLVDLLGKGPGGWGVAALLAGLILAWNAASARLVPRLLCGVPLDRSDLDERFAAVLSRSTVRRPRLHRIGPTKGRWANALALPSLGTPGVAFTRTLLDELEADEIAAIFAHEVAHLEHYDRRRVLRLSLGFALVVLVVAFLLPWLLRGLGEWAGLARWVWPLGILLALGARAARHKAHEADSDRRAVALCGDGEALVRALTKLHALALLPRRWEADTERWASHPSLAHRIQAIRSTAGAEAASPPIGPLVAGGAVGRFVVLDADRAHWFEGVPQGTPRDPAALRERAASIRSVVYGELTDLRLKPVRGGGLELKAVDRAGRAWSLPVAQEDATALQAALASVDTRLAPHPPDRSAPRLVATLVSTAAMLASVQMGVIGTLILPALLVLVRPDAAPLAALGAASVAQAATAAPGEGALPATAALLVPIGAIAGFLAWRAARREGPGPAWSFYGTAGLLAAAALLAWAALAFILAAEGVGLRLHQAARQWSSAGGLTLALAAALATHARGWSRALAAACALLSAVPFGLRSDWFRERFVQDPLLARAPLLRWEDRTLSVLREEPVSPSAGDLRLSPSAKAYAVGLFDEAGGADGGLRTFEAGRFGGRTRKLTALDVAFLDDERLVAMDARVSGLVVFETAVEAPGPPGWRVERPFLAAPRLLVQPETGAWRVVGMDMATREIVRLSGAVGSDRVDETRWRTSSPYAATAMWHAGSGDTALTLRFETGGVFSPWALLLTASYPMTTELWALGPRGERRLASSALRVQCLEPEMDDPGFTCLAADGQRTAVWSVDSTSGVLTPLGSVSAELVLPSGVPGGLLASRNVFGGPVLVNFKGGTASRLVTPRTAQAPHELVPYSSGFGALAGRGRGGVITLYAIP